MTSDVGDGVPCTCASRILSQCDADGLKGMEAQSGMQSSEQEEIGMGDHTEPSQALLATSLTCCSFCFAALMLLPSDGGLGLPAN